MNLLAFDTSTEILRVAVQAAHGVRAEHEAAGGAHASASLIPVIQSLLARCGLRLAQLDAIVFGRGPGSFTGLRTACSVAQGLAFGAGVPVLGVETLLAVAEDARQRSGAERVLAMLDARMHEVYAARYIHEANGWRREGPITLGAPGQLQVPPDWALAGNVFGEYGERIAPAAARIEAAPTAQALLRLAPALIADGQAQPADRATPLYIRDKVAQTTEERAALRAAARPSP
ncbi:tRNA (adenosine(37)-N6)-threonylcarbamoyltransferase complex dimerization subunit type 1 TsaB [Ramlibacter solisilvae]|uniref:Peptidase M22 n=1 Tax=Ramlibacter tataouinensis TaxID=94132 RepID=A0A127JT30_9BURK|nr:tRNA (adenosine(37)-N6)-threonylcarbamoyltransferase complex dimerization subunit type 1 TsaB [Ramlibacter tataouinensis]AMO23080.1 peptidase M22 [Ramlibacter tataouinensis]